jgi:hypothetical protein
MDPTTNTTPHLANSGAYNPYNGREALDILMKRLYNQLRDHQEFGSHLAYTRFEYDFTLNFKAESLEPTIIKGKERHGVRPVDASFTIKGTSAQAPDDGRREAGLVVPAPTLTAGGMVDIPLQSQTPQP